jgi:hypothetical protein
MNSPWFANKGQMLQLTVAAVACLFSGIPAWQAVKNRDLWSIGPLLFLILAGWLAYSINRLVAASHALIASPTPPASKASPEAAPARPDPFAPTVKVVTHTIPVGSSFEFPRGRLSGAISLKFRRILQNAKEYPGDAEFGVELEVNAIMEGGEKTKRLSAGRHILPEAPTAASAEESSICQYSFDEQSAAFIGVRVKHIYHNPYGRGEATFVVCRFEWVNLEEARASLES